MNNEQELLDRATIYMKKLSQGINPLDDTVIEDNDIINNIKISRCFSYVTNLLENYHLKRKTGILIPNLSKEDINNFPYEDGSMSISEIIKRANDLLKSDDYKRFNVSKVNDILTKYGYLTSSRDNHGKMHRVITSKGEELGIKEDVRKSLYGEVYTVNLFNKEAQKYIVENILANYESDLNKINIPEILI